MKTLGTLFFTFCALAISFAQSNTQVRLDDVFFDKNQSDIKGAAKSALDYNITLLKKHKEIHIMLNGYIDEIEFETNQGIHEKRLQSVIKYLKKNEIDLNRIYVSEEKYHYETHLYFANTLGGDLKDRMHRKVSFKLIKKDPEQDENIVTAHTFINTHHHEIHDIIVQAKEHPEIKCTYKIQLAALSDATKQSEFQPLEVETIPFGNGLFRYTTGNTTNIEDAIHILTAVQLQGFTTAFIIVNKDEEALEPTTNHTTGADSTTTQVDANSGQ
ncbi:MAG: OmpA family protein [Cytophagales bacterium]|nr:OmpA family protein [Cytophagales bacterium]